MRLRNPSRTGRIRLWNPGKTAMSTVSDRWEALCEQLDSAIEAWQKQYRLDVSQRDAAYGRVVDVGDHMRALIGELSDGVESSLPNNSAAA
jgi:hypothetical protein